MAVGKGSMERASKAAVQKTPEKTAVKKTTVKATPKTRAAKTIAAKTIAAPDPEVMDQIVYQNSSEMVYRDAKPNERFEIGDSMPVYYF